jgi:hypothetical protein
MDSEATLVVVFGSPAYSEDRTALDELVRAYPTSLIIGCSSAGEIHGDEVSDDSLSVAVMRFDRTRIRVASVPVQAGAPSAAAGEQLGRELAAPDLRAVFVLSDGLAVNGTSLLQGIHSVVADGVVVTGGLAGDGTRFKNTWVLANGVPAAATIAGLGLYGDAVQVTHGSRGGWDAFGPERLRPQRAGWRRGRPKGRPLRSRSAASAGGSSSENAVRKRSKPRPKAPRGASSSASTPTGRSRLSLLASAACSTTRR